MKKVFLSILLSVCAVVCILADNAAALVVRDVTVVPGNTIAKPISLANATAINSVKAAANNAADKIYSFGGQSLNRAGKGINIIRTNGVVKKVLNK